MCIGSVLLDKHQSVSPKELFLLLFPPAEVSYFVPRISDFLMVGMKYDFNVILMIILLIAK